jgi:hypothetical protein
VLFIDSKRSSSSVLSGVSGDVVSPLDSCACRRACSARNVAERGARSSDSESLGLTIPVVLMRMFRSILRLGDLPLPTDSAPLDEKLRGDAGARTGSGNAMGGWECNGGLAGYKSYGPGALGVLGVCGTFRGTNPPYSVAVSGPGLMGVRGKPAAAGVGGKPAAGVGGYVSWPGSRILRSPGGGLAGYMSFGSSIRAVPGLIGPGLARPYMVVVAVRGVGATTAGRVFP